MKLITLDQLLSLPKWSFICRCDAGNSAEPDEPSGGLYIWHGVAGYVDRGIPKHDLRFGYAIDLVKDGYYDNWEEGLSQFPSRFYFRKDGEPATGDERFYVYTREELLDIRRWIGVALEVMDKCLPLTPA